MAPTAIMPVMKVMAESHRPSRGERNVLLGLALLALVVGVVAFPRMIAGALFALAPGTHENGDFPQSDESAGTLSLLERAQWWAESSDVGMHLALTLHLAGKGGEENVLAGLLANSPLRPKEWFLLARQKAEGSPQSALNAWRMSVYVGRVFPSIMEERLDVGLMLKDKMAPSDLALLDDQVRLSFVVRPAHTNRVMSRVHNVVHREYVAAIVRNLSEADIDSMVRIHALH
jgi:hypothetical protein